MLAYSLKTFGSVSVRELLPENIGRWIKHLPVSAKTKQHALAAMRQVLSAGVVWGYLREPGAAGGGQVAAVAAPDDPSRSSRGTRLRSPAQQTATAARRLRLRDRAPPEEWSRCNGGTSIAAPVAARSPHLRLGRGPHGGKARGIPAYRSARRPCARGARQAAPVAPSDQLVFPATKGGHINLTRTGGAGSGIQALERAGFERRPLYQMRHTFATLALAAGMPIDFVSRQLGHTDIRTTLRFYARYIPALEERHLAMLNDGWSAMTPIGARG